MCIFSKYQHQPQYLSVCLQDLKEECVKLRTRVFDLEQQNRILSVLFQQRVKMSTIPVSQVGAHGAVDTNRHWQSCPASRLFEFYMSSAPLLKVTNFKKDYKEKEAPTQDAI